QRRRAPERSRDIARRLRAHVTTVPTRSRELDEERLERLHVGGAHVRDGLPPDHRHPAATAWRDPLISATASTSASASASVVISVHCKITSSRPRRLPST